MSSDRRYHLKARAARQQETREHIIAATAALHEEVGPARTTFAEIARRAGVQRLTVYNNFPVLKDLLGACQGRFLAACPPPNIAPRGPREGLPARLEDGLCDLYRWYRANEHLERNVHRDRHLVPELDELMRQNADPPFAVAASAYAKVLTNDRRRREAVFRLLRVAMEFRTWDVLNGQGATDREMAQLFRHSVSCISGTDTGSQAGRGLRGATVEPV